MVVVAMVYELRKVDTSQNTISRAFGEPHVFDGLVASVAAERGSALIGALAIAIFPIMPRPEIA